MRFTEEEKKRLTEVYVDGGEVFAGKVVHVDHWNVILPDGRPAVREVIRHPGAAAMVPVDDNGNVTMVCQYRTPIRQLTWEIPAGKRDNGEDPLLTAHRELREECGLQASEMKLIVPFASSCGIIDEIIYIYLATGLTPCDTDPDEDEFLNVRSFPLEEVADMCVRGEITDGKTIAGIMLARELLRNR